MKHLDSQVITIYCYIEYLCALRDEADMKGDEAVRDVISQQIEVEEAQMSDLIEIEKALQPSLN